MAIHLTEGWACDIVKSGNAQARLVVSTMGFKAAVVATLAAYFLLFVFTFKVGKSYENSVNHGGNTSHHLKKEPKQEACTLCFGSFVLVP